MRLRPLRKFQQAKFRANHDARWTARIGPVENAQGFVLQQRYGAPPGTKGRLTFLFALRRIRVADGHKHRMRDNRMQCMPGERSGPSANAGRRRAKYYVSNLSADTSLKKLAASIKARWVCEQGHQQLKEELGLDRFKSRSWTGLYRHALMTMVAYAFLHSPASKPRRGKKESGNHHRNQPSASHSRPPCAASPKACPIVRISSTRPSNLNCQSSASPSYSSRL